MHSRVNEWPIQEGVQEQRLKLENGQSERPDSRGRQQQLVAISQNKEAAVQEQRLKPEIGERQTVLLPNRTDL